MSVSKDVFEKACKEVLEAYTEDTTEKKTFYEMEKAASKFSDTIMKRALELSLEEDRNDKKKKAYVRSVEHMLSQLDSGKERF